MVLACVIFALPASAAPTTLSSDDAALALYHDGSQAYAEGRFSDAASLLTQAYALKKEPVILFNLAHAYEGQGNLEGAVDAYQRFLESQPNVSDARSIEQRVANLQKLIRDRTDLKNQRDAARTQATIEFKNALEDRARIEAEHRRKWQTIMAWVVTGAGAAGVGAGVVFAVVAQNNYNSSVADPFLASSQQEYRNATTFGTGATIAFIAGGVVAGAGILWKIVQAATTTKSATVSIGLGPTGVRIEGAF